MTDYLDWVDPETIITNLITGVIGGLIVLGIARYWSNRSIRSIKRRIEQTEASKTKLDNLARSDRALIIYGFQGVSAIICIMSLIVCLHLMIDTPPVTLRMLIVVILWFIPALLSMGIVFGLQQIADYPKSIEKIEQRITKLKNKLLGQ
jgi:hypothetical protein